MLGLFLFLMVWLVCGHPRHSFFVLTRLHLYLSLLVKQGKICSNFQDCLWATYTCKLGRNASTENFTGIIEKLTVRHLQ